MRFFFILIVLFASSCGGSLSSEQRKKIRENMEAKAIKKISDAELTEAALAYARPLATLIEARDKDLSNRPYLDSLEKKFGVQILAMQPTDSMLRGVERKIIEAYTSTLGAGVVNLGDNLQRMGNDSLLYTKPLMKELPDGSIAFTKALGVRIPKKQIILSIKD